MVEVESGVNDRDPDVGRDWVGLLAAQIPRYLIHVELPLLPRCLVRGRLGPEVDGGLAQCCACKVTV